MSMSGDDSDETTQNAARDRPARNGGGSVFGTVKECQERQSRSDHGAENCAETTAADPDAMNQRPILVN